MNFVLTKNTTNCLKVVAALLVMLHHYFFFTNWGMAYRFWFFTPILWYGGRIGVALFFFLSGYGLMESERRSHLDARQFVRRRFLRVYLPVVGVTALWMCAEYFWIGQANIWFQAPEDPILGSIYTLLVSFDDPAMWFVRVLLGLYAVFYIFTLLRNSHKTIAYSFLIGATAAITLITVNQMAIWAAISIPLFAMGVVISEYKNNKPVLLSCVVSCIALSIASIIATHFKHSDFNTGTAACINYAMMALMMLLFSRWRIDIPFAGILGAMSFDVYLVHMKVIMSVESMHLSERLWFFLGATLALTIAFYALRQAIAKLASGPRPRTKLSSV